MIIIVEYKTCIMSVKVLPFFLLLMSTNVIVVTLLNIRPSMKEFLFHAQYSHGTTGLMPMKGSTKEEF